MTGQVADAFLYQDEGYSIVGINGGSLFEPLAYNIETIAASTACWRGFQAFYTLLDNKLMLKELFLNSKKEEIINEQKPKNVKSMFRFRYPKLNLEINFTGKLLIARDFISELYVHMGFQSPESFKTVLEFIFEEGVLTEVIDLSEQMEKLRENDYEQRTKPNDPNDSFEVDRWIRDRFSLEYGTKNDD